MNTFNIFKFILSVGLVMVKHGTQVFVYELTNEKSLAGLLEGHDGSRALEPQVSLEVIARAISQSRKWKREVVVN